MKSIASLDPSTITRAREVKIEVEGTRVVITLDGANEKVRLELSPHSALLFAEQVKKSAGEAYRSATKISNPDFHTR